MRTKCQPEGLEKEKARLAAVLDQEHSMVSELAGKLTKNKH